MFHIHPSSFQAMQGPGTVTLIYLYQTRPLVPQTSLPISFNPTAALFSSIASLARILSLKKLL